MKLGRWEINRNRTLATLWRDDGDLLSVTVSPDGSAVRIYDHRSFYPCEQHEIPLAVIQALRPGGFHPGDGEEWEEGRE